MVKYGGTTQARGKPCSPDELRNQLPRRSWEQNRTGPVDSTLPVHSCYNAAAEGKDKTRPRWASTRLSDISWRTVGSQTFARRLAADATAASPPALAVVVVTSQTDSHGTETAYGGTACHNLLPVHAQAQSGGRSGPADSKEGSDEEEEEEEFVFWHRLSCSLPPAGRLV